MVHKSFDYKEKQDKYKMHPGCQIYLSNDKKNFGQKWFLNNKIKKNFQKNFFSTKNLGESKVCEIKFVKKIFLHKNLKKLQVTIPSVNPVQISSRLDYCITLS